jgi:hypothetical protein
MEFLRFGSSIPGAYWGCCAVDIIQNFKKDPDEKASIQIVNGDAGVPVGDVYVGKTYREIFLSRLRFGTFSQTDMPNHGFIAILTEWQINSSPGNKWLPILKEAGFEFVRTVNNSVYSGQNLSSQPTGKSNNNDNHIFMLIRNIGSGALKDPFTAPKAWSDLPSVKPEAWEFIPSDERKLLTNGQFQSDKTVWEKIGKPTFYTRKALEDANIPVWFGGVRNKHPQELATTREAKKEAKAMASSTSAFPNAAYVVTG